MGFLRNLSDSLWAYVSPGKKQNPPSTTPKTVPQPNKPEVVGRRPSLQNTGRHSRSMSPVERVAKWRMASLSQSDGHVPNRKRKRSIISATSALRHNNVLRLKNDSPYATPRSEDGMVIKREELDSDDEHEVDDYEEHDFYEDEASEDGENASNMEDELLSDSSVGHVGQMHSDGCESEQEDVVLDDTLVVSEEQYQRSTRKRRRLVTPTREHLDRGVSSEALRARGCDDDHIELVQKIAMRGLEPLMSSRWKFDFRYLPDSLFYDDDDAPINSIRGDHYRATKALEKLFELGGWVRDRVAFGGISPEVQVWTQMKEYIKWADEDSGLDQQTAIPLVVLESAPADVPADEVKENAQRKLAKVANRYREAFRVKQSIESSPKSVSTQLYHSIPTLYAIIASHTLVAIVAYNPESENPEVQTISFHNMSQKDYDVWNSFALALTVCHARNIQIRIAEETGLGLKHVVQEDESSDLSPVIT